MSNVLTKFLPLLEFLPPPPRSHKSHNPGWNGWNSDFIIQTSNSAHSNAIDEQIKLLLVKHFKMHSLLSKLQKLKLCHTENHDIPSGRIASIRTYLKIFLLNQQIGRGIHSKFTRSIFVWIFGSLFRQKCTVHDQYSLVLSQVSKWGCPQINYPVARAAVELSQHHHHPRGCWPPFWRRLLVPQARLPSVSSVAGSPGGMYINS